MPRGKTPSPREVAPDIKYNNVQIAMFINRMMKKGKKSTARRIMYDAFDMIEARMGRDPVEVFEEAIRNVTPSAEVKPRRVGGSTYQVPVDVSPDRGFALAVRWILAAARARGGRGMADKLAAELMDAANQQGAAIRRRDETHRMADANRAFAHYRW
jgi:small subunit ribosomal protein S7